MKKDDLIEKAKALGVELDSNETVADLEAKIFQAENHKPLSEATAGGELTRAKVNRGSRRRLERAVTRLSAELDAAIKEFDHQAFLADEDGNRIGEWFVVSDLRLVRQRVNDLVNELLAG